MALENKVASTYNGPATQPGLGGATVFRTASLEVTAAANANSTYAFFKLPSRARLHGASQIFFDDLASTGSPTLDIGVFAVDGNITDDADALNDGIDCATAAGSARVVKDVANYGKMLWQIAGLSSDPGGLFGIKVSLVDAASDTGGSLTMELAYSVD